ncbi:hypothetical protein CEXT_231571 [Caerostris extrusa]|uniref:Uncharacterized protein n=1 Tax=Caerostris extrusa TaxID=172846 RepID=A0AAV4XNN3_CAEEX|nr:hypothetical protein CEXT_231571 [Caerostris extrusa]
MTYEEKSSKAQEEKGLVRAGKTGKKEKKEEKKKKTRVEIFGISFLQCRFLIHGSWARQTVLSRSVNLMHLNANAYPMGYRKIF